MCIDNSRHVFNPLDPLSISMTIAFPQRRAPLGFHSNEHSIQCALVRHESRIVDDEMRSLLILIRFMNCIG